jgi:hypothetical protein
MRLAVTLRARSRTSGRRLRVSKTVSMRHCRQKRELAEKDLPVHHHLRGCHHHLKSMFRITTKKDGFRLAYVDEVAIFLSTLTLQHEVVMAALCFLLPKIFSPVHVQMITTINLCHKCSSIANHFFDLAIARELDRERPPLTISPLSPQHYQLPPKLLRTL